MRGLEGAAQVAVGHAQARGDLWDVEVPALLHGAVDLARRVLGQRLRRVHQRQPRRQFGPAAHAGAKAGGFGAGGVVEEAAVAC